MLYGLDRTDDKESSCLTNDFRDLAAMEEVAFQVYQHEQRCSRTNDDVHDDSDTYSPYVPLCLFQSILVEQLCWKRGGKTVHYDAAQFLIQVLESYTSRWTNAGMPAVSMMIMDMHANNCTEFYLKALRADNPTLLPVC